jgi:hypothetical protein
MDSVKFAGMRKRLNVTRRQLSHLLDVSPGTIRRYEKGRKPVPAHVEQQLFTLTSKSHKKNGYEESHWQINGCSTEQRLSCPAWELRAGQASWFMNAAMCYSSVGESWTEKMTMCRSCEMFQGLL